MSVKVRLAKFGKKNAPSYKIVVANTRDKRNGKFLDVLGFFNPFQKESKFDIDKKKLNSWKEKGAQVTEAVDELIEGKYSFVKYNPKKDTKDKEAQDTQA